MPVKKSTSPATQLSLEGATPSRASGSKGTRKKSAGPKVRGIVAPGRKRPRPTNGARPETELSAAVRALEQVAESLHFTHESFAQSLLRLPRAEDYDPLADTLRRLAAAAPAILASRASAPPEAADAHRAANAPISARVRAAVRAAREHLEEALRTLPGPADYEPAARNLRAMASVSPSLVAWLREVPTLVTPLAGSVRGLEEAIVELDRALEAMDDEPVPGASRVKVVVRG